MPDLRRRPATGSVGADRVPGREASARARPSGRPGSGNGATPSRRPSRRGGGPAQGSSARRPVVRWSAGSCGDAGRNSRDQARSSRRGHDRAGALRACRRRDRKLAPEAKLATGGRRDARHFAPLTAGPLDTAGPPLDPRGREDAAWLLAWSSTPSGSRPTRASPASSWPRSLRSSTRFAGSTPSTPTTPRTFTKLRGKGSAARLPDTAAEGRSEAGSTSSFEACAWTTTRSDGKRPNHPRGTPTNFATARRPRCDIRTRWRRPTGKTNALPSTKPSKRCRASRGGWSCCGWSRRRPPTRSPTNWACPPRPSAPT